MWPADTIWCDKYRERMVVMDGNGMLVWLVFFPMAGAGFTYLVGRRNKTARDYVADIIVVLEFLAALYVFGMSNIAWQLSKNPANSFGYTSYCDVFWPLRAGAPFYFGWIPGFVWVDCGIYVDGFYGVFQGVF